MQREAQAIVAERRGPEISALTTESGRDGVFVWAGGQPQAGQRALLAYNKACGALRYCFIVLAGACSVDTRPSYLRQSRCCIWQAGASLGLALVPHNWS